MLSRTFVFLLLAGALVAQGMNKRRGKKDKGKDRKMKDLSEENPDLEDLLEKIEALEARLGDGEGSGGPCGSKVHFFFHGDDDDQHGRRGPPRGDRHEDEDHEGHDHEDEDHEGHDHEDEDHEGHDHGRRHDRKDNDQYVHVFIHQKEPKFDHRGGPPRGGPMEGGPFQGGPQRRPFKAFPSNDGPFEGGPPCMQRNCCRPGQVNCTDPPCPPCPRGNFSRPGDFNKTAICSFEHTISGIFGHAHFFQSSKDQYTKVKFHFENVGEPESEIRVHVHENGDITHDCVAIGGHYDPYMEDIDVGDVGTITVDADGNVADTWINDTHVTLFTPWNIIGRSMAVHNESGIIGCCVIGVGSTDEKIMKIHSHAHGERRAGKHGHGHRHGPRRSKRQQGNPRRGGQEPRDGQGPQGRPDQGDRPEQGDRTGQRPQTKPGKPQ